MTKASDHKPGLSLASQVLIGLALGIITGVFFGEKVAWLDVIGNAFIMLLTMTVFPYITVSLIVGLAQLTYGEAKSLALKGATIWSISPSRRCRCISRGDLRVKCMATELHFW